MDEHTQSAASDKATESDIIQHLCAYGLDHIFWLPQLKKLGIKYKSALQYIEGDMDSFSMLEKETRFQWEKRALCKLLKIDDAGIKKGKKIEVKDQIEMKEQQGKINEGNKVHKEDTQHHEENAQKQERKDHHDDRVEKEASPVPDNSIDDEVKSKLKPHDKYSGQLLESEHPSELLQRASNGRALQGIFLTKRLQEQLEDRCQILEVPKKVVMAEVANIHENTLQFSSTLQEDEHQNTLRVLGRSIAQSKNVQVYGSATIGAAVKRKQVEGKETYIATVKYSTMHMGSYSLSINDLKLCKDAKDDLQLIQQKLKPEKADSSSVQKACIDFFNKYGSHVNWGPLSLGGTICWTCSSRGFNLQEKEAVLKMQSEVISLSTERGIFSEIYKGKHSIDAHCCLEVKMSGGAPESADLSSWKDRLMTDKSTWSIIDRGDKLVAVWDIIRINHAKELGMVADTLRTNWEKKTMLKARSPTYESKHVLKKVSQWNKEYLATHQIEENLNFLLDVKMFTHKKNLWISEYLSQPSLQKFFLSVVDAKHEPFYFERIKFLMQQLLKQENLRQLNARTFPQLEHLSEWLYRSSPQSTSDIIDDQSSAIQFKNNPAFHKLLQKLDLCEYYPKGLKLQDALCIRLSSLKLSLNIGHPNDSKQLPYLILQKIMAYDSLCRSNLLHQRDDRRDSSSDDDLKLDSDVTKIHPVDSLLSVLLCSDDFLCQDLFSRLAKCQLALPFILPDPITKQLTLPLWALRSVIKDWKKTISDGKVVEETQPIIKYEMPIVSFIRLGKHQRRGASKSKMLNEVISDSHYDHFFHRDCGGGQYNSVLGEGLVDMCWYLPTGKPTDAFPDVVTFLNLHGNAMQYPQQTKFLSQISSMCFVLVTEESLKLDRQTMEILKRFSSPGGITLLKDVEKVSKALTEEIPGVRVIELTIKNAADIKDAIRHRLKRKLFDGKECFRTIEDCCESSVARKHSICIDEANSSYKEGRHLANDIKSIVTSHKVNGQSAKEAMLPLQGEHLWQAWAVQDKESHRQLHRGRKSVIDYTDIISNKKTEIREQQLKHVKTLTPVMKLFKESLMKLRGPSNRLVRNYFLQCLKQSFDDLSRTHISKLQHQYHSTRVKLAKAQTKGNSSKSEEEDTCQLIKQYKHELEVLRKDIIDSSFGLEHLFRELGQVYEAAKQSQDSQNFSHLPKVAAELLIEGYPLELMDGDAAHVPKEWVTAVIKEVTDILEDPKVFVLSVLGLQSTGKSTMLNTTFGLQFNVSAGRCTRGAFMQLLPLDEELQAKTNCTYILVVDTEGLRAPELDSKQTQKHDNELAAFVIGLANMTLINIYGEVPGDMDDILQTSVHAFLRMKKVKLNPSCQFIHQNAGASIKSEVGHEKFTQKLNQFTVNAAREENCKGQFVAFNDVIMFNDQEDIHCFPGLWKGDPPMAPVNPGYSNAAQMLKYHTIEMVCKRTTLSHLKGRVGDLEVSAFQHRVCDLWQALLKENFVFSFKNTLEIIAYSSLEAQYDKVSWKLQEELLNWERKVDNEITTADPETIPQLVRQKCEELRQLVSDLYETLKIEMDEFIHGSKQSETLVQWKANFETKLSNCKQELYKHADSHCKRLGESRERITDLQRKQKEYASFMTQKVQALIADLKQDQKKLNKNLEDGILEEAQLNKILRQELFTPDKLERFKKNQLLNDYQVQCINDVIQHQCGGQLTEEGLKYIIVSGELLQVEEVKQILKQGRLTEDDLKQKFDTEWKKLIASLHVRPTELVDVESIAEQKLIDFMHRHTGQLIGSLQEGGRSLTWWGKQDDLRVEMKHYTVIKSSSWTGTVVNWLHTAKNNVFKINDPHEMEAQKITDRVFERAKECLKTITERDADFNATFIQELLRVVDATIKEESVAVKSRFTFTSQYILDVCLTVCGYAVPAFKKMAASFKERNDPLIYLEKNMKDPLFAKYKNQYNHIEAEEVIANTLCAHLCKPMEVQVRKSLGGIMVGQMKQSEQHFTSKMALKAKILIDLHNEGDFELYMHHVLHVKESLEEWVKRYIIQYCDKVPAESSTCTRLQISAKEEITRLIGVVVDKVTYVNETNVCNWLSAFCNDRDIRQELGVKLEARSMHDDEDIKELNLENFTSRIKEELLELKKNLHVAFNNIECESEMDNWQHKPLYYFKRLVGCTEQCPFCGEQCDLHEHTVDTTEHKCSVHRSTCFASYRNSVTQVMVTEFCPALVGSDGTFRNKDTKEQKHPYRDYKKIYPHWSIIPDVTSEDSQYWMMFVATYNKSIAERFHVKPANVPKGWSKIQWENVKTHLETQYNLKLD